MDNNLHIVSFNVPYPADYGGVIDVYYRLKTLYELGVKLHLHCFTYGREPSKQLEGICQSVTYYQRAMGAHKFIDPRPYIVSSRDNAELIRNLKKDNYPIFLEGIHCCSVLEALPDRAIYVRAHNVEQDYYSNLADSVRNVIKRMYLRIESRRLKRYEPIITKASGVFAVTEADAAHFREIGCEKVWLMPSSHIDDTVKSQLGQGDFALYHGDLSVPENIGAARFLVESVFSDSPHRLVLAGRNPSPQLIRLVENKPNITILPNPDNVKMQQLISDAQVNILVTGQPTGLKLKLLNSLYAGRHCLVNNNMVAGTELGKVCVVADTAEQLVSELDRLMKQPFSTQDVENRKITLGERYSNKANAKILISGIFGND